MSPTLVLCYHAVSEDWPAALSISPASFERQISGLLDRGWRAATFSDAAIGRPREKTLVVSFDDAFLSVLEAAAPILDQLAVPATVFAPTAFMDRRQPLAWDGTARWLETEHARSLRGMDWDDLLALSARGWEIGSHTRTHPRLTALDDEGLSAELLESKRACEHHVGQPCISVAYPYGSVDDRVVAAARQAGYLCGAGLSSSLADHGVLRRPRIGIYHNDDGRRFKLKVNPMVRWLRARPLWPAHE